MLKEFTPAPGAHSPLNLLTLVRAGEEPANCTMLLLCSLACVVSLVLGLFGHGVVSALARAMALSSTRRTGLTDLAILSLKGTMELHARGGSAV